MAYLRLHPFIIAVSIQSKDNSIKRASHSLIICLDCLDSALFPAILIASCLYSHPGDRSGTDILGVYSCS